MLALGASIHFLSSTHVPRYASITFSDQTKIMAEVADTQLLRQQGLSNRPALAESEGMLFLFEEPQEYTFWMKEMEFPIDIVWLRDGEVVDVNANVQVDTTLPLAEYAPNEPVNQVLEVTAGFADRHGIRVGDRLDIQGD